MAQNVTRFLCHSKVHCHSGATTICFGTAQLGSFRRQRQTYNKQVRPRPRVTAARDKAEGICMQLRYTQGAYCPLPSATVKNPHPPTRQRPSPAAPRGRPSFLLLARKILPSCSCGEDSVTTTTRHSPPSWRGTGNAHNNQ